MQASKHPLLGPLMTCMAQLLRDHKAEIEDILAGDRQLAKELAFDMRQAEAANKATLKSSSHLALPALAPPHAPSGPPKTPGCPSGAQPMSVAGRSAALSSVLKKKDVNEDDKEDEEDNVSQAIASLTPAPVSSKRGTARRSSLADDKSKDDDDEVVVHLPLNNEALEVQPSALKPWSLNQGEEGKSRERGKERAKAKVKAVRELTRASIGSLLGEEDENEPEPAVVFKTEKPRASRKRNAA